MTYSPNVWKQVSQRCGMVEDSFKLLIFVQVSDCYLVNGLQLWEVIKTCTFVWPLYFCKTISIWGSQIRAVRWVSYDHPSMTVVESFDFMLFVWACIVRQYERSMNPLVSNHRMQHTRWKFKYSTLVIDFSLG